jgi:hypothetical protein
MGSGILTSRDCRTIHHIYIQADMAGFSQERSCDPRAPIPTAVVRGTESEFARSLKTWDSSITFDYIPKQYITFRAEYDYRHASAPYWTGAGGVTPPGGSNGSPQYYVCSSGRSSGQTSLGPAESACGGGLSSVWFPDLRKNESFIDLAIMVKF